MPFTAVMNKIVKNIKEMDHSKLVMICVTVVALAIVAKETKE